MSDAGLEKAIDEVGRDRVFAYARALGWNPADAPPISVWWSIIHELKNADPETGARGSEKHEVE